MVEKKSLTAAIIEAQDMSIQHPSITYWVLDKPRKRSIVVSVDWIYREHILDGWHCRCKVINGTIIKVD